jgi:putative transposase
LQSWLAQRGTLPVSIAPEHLWENGDAESCIGKGRDACLNEASLRSVEEARVVIAGWRWASNHRRPHRALGYQTPAEGLDNDTLNATEARQGHRLNFSLDQF